MARHWSLGLLVLGLAACGASSPAAPAAKPQAVRARPCFTIRNDSELRAKDAKKTIDDLAQHIRLAPEDETLRQPQSLADVRKVLQRDCVYLFANASAFARSLDSLDGRFVEATLELLLGESQLVASQVLTTQEAWLGGDLRIARANLATAGAAPRTDRERMLAQLIRVVEEGNKIGDALGIVAPEHLVHGAEVIRRIEKDAPSDPRTFTLVAEYHRLRGEWSEFEHAMKSAEAAAPAGSAPLCYLRGMEQLERFRRPDLGANAMRDCLKRYPRFVRAQAALVLMATNVEDGLREIDRLRALNEDHYLVMLLEPTLAADEELTRMQKSAAPASGGEGDAR